jgi:hypothetical protein
VEVEHGAKLRHEWRKLHFAADARTSMIMVQTPTNQGTDDQSQQARLLNGIGAKVARW